METATRYSPKREAILKCLRSTTCHPSAEWVYTQLKPQIPDLSLATVYRNLARFRSESTVQVIGCVDGEDRYDGNVAPHAAAARSSTCRPFRWTPRIWLRWDGRRATALHSTVGAISAW